MKINAIFWILAITLLAGCEAPTSKSIYPTEEWKKQDPEKAGFSMQALAQIDSLMKKANANGVLIYKGYMVAEWNYGGTVSQQYEVQSITKSITSAVLGLALKDGLKEYGKNRLLQNILLFSLFIYAIISGCKNNQSINASDVIVLFNSNAPTKSVAIEKVVPYLNHFGVKSKTIDIAKEEMTSASINPALVIIGHSEILPDGDKELAGKLEKYLNKCQSKGTGILSFDPLMPKGLLTQPGEESEKDMDVGELLFSNEDHYITEYRQTGEKQNLFGYMSIPKLSIKTGQVLLTGNDLPLLVVSSQQKGKVAQWTSTDWMYYSILGPLGGLDDCLGISIAWTARKPFVMQSLPPIATMRVDDVMGTGRQQWDVSPFHWVKSANKYGLKPWLGLFIYNISPEGINELKGLTDKGLATSSPHALGRPPRPESSQENFEAYYKPQMVDEHFIPDYWYPKAIPYLSEYYDEFIFFDHNNQKPWSNDTAQMILKAVDDWYADIGPLPMSYLIPHWGEMGSNMVDHVYDKWNIRFIWLRMVDKSWGSQPSLYGGGYVDNVTVEDYKWENKVGPFRLYDEPVVGKPKKDMTSSRATYTSDFVEFAGKKFFCFSSNINDLTGYDWQPDNDVEATATRGIKTLSRGLSGRSLAVLFTHETDYIFKVEPENWDKIFKKVSEGISMYNPIYLNTRDALKYIRALHTSEIQNCIYNENSGELTIEMTGETDVPTSVFVYTDNGVMINEELVEMPAFQNEVSQAFKLSK